MDQDNGPKQLLVVDDSRIMRRALTRIFTGVEGIHVVGEAADGREALDMVQELRPHVVTLDVAMPVMDGLTALKHMMIRCPVPTVMLSAYTEEGARITFDALRYGAVDFSLKPARTSDLDIEDQRAELVRKVRLAAEMEISTLRYIRMPRNGAVVPERPTSPRTCDCVVVIGAAEGGYSPLLKIVPRLAPEADVAYLVMLYAPAPYVDAFASYLNECSPITVRRATHGERIFGGVCYLASGEEYMTMHRQGPDLLLYLRQAPFSFRRGSINMLMFSVAEAMKYRSAGVLLSGAGNDGAEGLDAIHRAGGACVVQEPRTCLYREMAEHAMERGNVDGVVADSELAGMLNQVFAPVNGDAVTGIRSLGAEA